MCTDRAHRLTNGEILIVEDTASSLKLLSDILTKAGYRVRPASDGELSLRSVQARRPDLILLDFRLPGMNGVEVCRRLKDDPATRDIPVIFISVSGDAKLKVMALKAGAVDYVTKPIEPSEVLARIDTHLTIYRMRRDLRAQTEELEMHRTHLETLVEKRTADLRDSEEKARALMNATTDLAMLLKPDGILVAANKAAKDAFGLTGEELVGKSPFDFGSPEITEGRWKSFGELVARKKPVRLELKTGERCFDTSIYPILDREGDVWLVAMFAQDITRRRQAEETIKRRERYLMGLNDAAETLLASVGEVPFQALLDNIAPASNASRAYVFMNRRAPDGGLLMDLRAEWCAEGIKPEIDNPLLQDRSYDEWIPRWKETLSASGILTGRVRDFPEQEREILETQGILSILIIPIMIDTESVGFIGFDNCVCEREWDEVEQAFLRTAANHLAQAIRRARSEAQVRSSLNEKEVLLSEIHHRVKNNLQIVTSLLALQAREITDKRALDAMTESQYRIRAMALIHEELYRSSDLSRVPMSDYFERLTGDIAALRIGEEGRIRCHVKADDVTLSISDAIPVGLIANELVSNAFKHAFPDGREGNVQIALHELEPGAMELIVSDNGVGLAEEITVQDTKTLGLRLVSNLAERQLDGALVVERGNGVAFHVRFQTTAG